VLGAPYDMRAGPGLAKSAPTPVAKKQTKLRWSGSFESNPEPALAKREPTSVDRTKFARAGISESGTKRTSSDVRLESVKRSRADIAKHRDLSVLAERPIDGRTPNAKGLCDGRRAVDSIDNEPPGSDGNGGNVATSGNVAMDESKKTFSVKYMR
jgi:hypothetical protein